MDKKPHSIMELSKHLFWDCPQEAHDWEQHAKFIVKRVLDYGLLQDWKIALDVYGLEKIADVATQIVDLTDISANYISTIADRPITDFQCYIRAQSIPHFSGY